MIKKVIKEDPFINFKTQLFKELHLSQALSINPTPINLVRILKNDIIHLFFSFYESYKLNLNYYHQIYRCLIEDLA